MRPFSGNVTACNSVVPIIPGATLRHQHMTFGMPETKNCVTTSPRADLKERGQLATSQVLRQRGSWAKAQRGGAKILPMHSARGLQFRIVLLLWADLLPSPFKNRDDGIDRGLLYVAMTRAEDMLVILHSGSSSYVEELYRALGTAPP